MSCWQVAKLWFKNAIIEVEYTYHPGEDRGSFGWRVPPTIEIHKVNVIEGELSDCDGLGDKIYDEFHR